MYKKIFETQCGIFFLGVRKSELFILVIRGEPGTWPTTIVSGLGNPLFANLCIAIRLCGLSPNFKIAVSISNINNDYLS